MTTLHLPPIAGAQLAAWQALLDLAPKLGGNWTLIGGQMVLMHQAERSAFANPEADTRFSVDLDLVFDTRARFRALAIAHDVLNAAGYEQDMPNRQGTAHRYRLGETVIDVLAPDHIGNHPPQVGVGFTLGIPGGSQALRRTEPVIVQIEQNSAAIRRPNLIGAIIIKATAATSSTPNTRGRDRHFQDLGILADLLTGRDLAAADLSKNEKKLLKAVSGNQIVARSTSASLLSLAESSTDPSS